MHDVKCSWLQSALLTLTIYVSTVCSQMEYDFIEWLIANIRWKIMFFSPTFDLFLCFTLIYSPQFNEQVFDLLIEYVSNEIQVIYYKCIDFSFFWWTKTRRQRDRREKNNRKKTGWLVALSVNYLFECSICSYHTIQVNILFTLCEMICRRIVRKWKNETERYKINGNNMANENVDSSKCTTFMWNFFSKVLFVIKTTEQIIYKKTNKQNEYKLIMSLLHTIRDTCIRSHFPSCHVMSCQTHRSTTHNTLTRRLSKYRFIVETLLFLVCFFFYFFSLSPQFIWLYMYTLVISTNWMGTSIHILPKYSNISTFYGWCQNNWIHI